MAFDFTTASGDALRNEFRRISAESGDDRFFTRKELMHLPKILVPNEPVLAFSSGLMDGNTWLIALTDRRVIFLDKGLIYGLKQKTIDLDVVNHVEGVTGIFFGTIKVGDGAREHVITNVWKKSVLIFVNKLRDAMERRKSRLRAGASASTASVSDQIAQLAKLRSEGHLTDDEFQSAKRKLLG